MIEILPDTEALASVAAEAAAKALRTAIDARGRAVLIGTGGRSPAPVYDRLSVYGLDWSRVTVSLSDERFVPPSDPASNEKLVRDRLLVENAAAARFEPLYRPLADEAAAASAAEAPVRALAPFDMMFLGMGEDGHIASLIPGNPTTPVGLDPACARWVLGVPAGTGEPPLARITLTLPALLASRSTLVLISGERKRAIVERQSGLPVHALLENAKAPVRVLWTP